MSASKKIKWGVSVAFQGATGLLACAIALWNRPEPRNAYVNDAAAYYLSWAFTVGLALFGLRLAHSAWLTAKYGWVEPDKNNKGLLAASIFAGVCLAIIIFVFYNRTRIMNMITPALGSLHR